MVDIRKFFKMIFGTSSTHYVRFKFKLSQIEAEKLWGHPGQARRGRREGPNEEIGAYHREGPPLSSLLCSLPWSRTMPGMQYATQYGKIIAGGKIVHFKKQSPE